MSKEQEIEEMARIAYPGLDHQTVFSSIVYAQPLVNLYNAGYRKQSEGEWIFNRGRTYGEPAYFCSKCSEGASEYGTDNFCPNCGAKMKGV